MFELEGYEIVQPLGSGGMAAVFLAYKTGAEGFRRPVVLKRILSRHRGKDAFEEMFVDEARLASRISHRAVVNVEELHRTDDGLVMVMEYVHGVPLSVLLEALGRRKRRLTAAAAVAIASEVAAGLHAAHETRGDDGSLLGLIHRDVSPQNIVLAANGEVKLIDFGVAKAKGRLHQTVDGGVKGKLRYMAPEQLTGRDLDRRVDVFALGVVLWEMLTNRRLFGERVDQEVIDRILTGDVPPPSRFAGELSSAIDEVVLRATNATPELRPQTARELRSAMVTLTPQVTDDSLAALLVGLVGPELEERARHLAGVRGSPLSTRELSSEPFHAVATLTVPVDGTDLNATHVDAPKRVGSAAPTEAAPPTDAAPSPTVRSSSPFAETRLERPSAPTPSTPTPSTPTPSPSAPSAPSTSAAPALPGPLAPAVAVGSFTPPPPMSSQPPISSPPASRVSAAPPAGPVVSVSKSSPIRVEQTGTTLTLHWQYRPRSRPALALLAVGLVIAVTVAAPLPASAESWRLLLLFVALVPLRMFLQGKRDVVIDSRLVVSDDGVELKTSGETRTFAPDALKGAKANASRVELSTTQGDIELIDDVDAAQSAQLMGLLQPALRRIVPSATFGTAAASVARPAMVGVSVLVALLAGVYWFAARPHTFTTEMTHAGRLEVGAPVQAHLGRVGEVTGIVALARQTRISFEIDSAHPVSLRSDACARLVDLGGGSYLELMPGVADAELEGQTLPTCTSSHEAFDRVFH